MHSVEYDRILVASKLKENEKLCLQSELTDTNIEAALLNFMIKERLPLSKVDSIHMKKVIQGECV